MRLEKLFPSSWNIFEIWNQFIAGQSTERLSDLFILLTIYLACAAAVWVFIAAVKSWVHGLIYLVGLPSRKKSHEFVEKRFKWAGNRWRPLAGEFNAMLVEIPSGDGSFDRVLRRCGEASDVFNERSLAHGLVGNRIFLAVPAILTGLGVLGTFLGLQFGIGELDLEEVDPEDLDKSIMPLIRGSSVAFATSVWGVGLSLVFAILEKVLEVWPRRIIRKLQMRLNAFVPRYSPEEGLLEIERHGNESEKILKGLASAIGDHMQTAIDRLGNSISDAVKDALSGQAQDLGAQSAELISKAMTEELGNMRSALTEMGENFRNEFSGANSTLQATMNDFRPVVESLGKTVASVEGSVNQAVERLDSHSEVVESLGAVTGKFQEATDKFLEMRETLADSSQQNRTASEAGKIAAEINQEVVAKFKQVSDALPQLQEAIETSVRVIGSIGQPLLELQEVLAKTPELFEQQAKNQADTEEKRSALLLQQTKSLVDAVSNAASKFGEIEGLATSLGQSASELSNASEELGRFGEQIENATREQAAAALASKDAASSGQKAAQALEPVPQSLTDLSSELERAAGSIKLGANAAKETYHELNQHQKVWFEGVENGLSVMRDRLQELIEAYGESVEGETRKHMERWTDEVEKTLSKFSNQVQDLQGAMDEFTASQDR
ncbi:anti-phage ZorAB system protein ZorA [bacterium]|nr:anti-phage ZorAB system protein ZorA [bacterium]